jgi:hypothetical protein
MDKITIHKNKGELFECQFRIDGAAIEDTVIRLCLEFDNNKNMFFYGTLKHDGTCSIDIPILKELSNQQGKLIIEAIADSTYFKLYEAEVEVKNSVEVSVMKKPTTTETKKTTIQLEQITPKQKTPKIQPLKKENDEGWEPAVQEPKTYKPVAKKEKSETIKRFEEYLQRKKE